MESKYWDVLYRLNIDFEEGIPAKFPGDAMGVLVSESGREIEGCDYN